MGEHSIHEVVRRTGVTSRTLRHYDAAGILTPSSVGEGGERRYDDAALVRLQRILVLRGLGLGIRAIRDVLEGSRDDVAALRGLVEELRVERDRIDRRVRAVEGTIRRRERGEDLMTDEMFDGLDHRRHRDEVEARWGRGAYADSEAWWSAKGPAERAAFREEQRALAAEWGDAAARSIGPAGDDAQGLAARHAAWLASIPGTPGYPEGPSAGYLAGLGELYVADERFRAAYGDGAAELVRDALAVYARRGR